MIQIKTILLFVMALTVSLQALTAFPMKLTVQRGDTLSFTPFVKGWDSTVTSVDVRLSTPANGTVRFIPEWFDSNSYYKSAMAAARTAPKGFPGLFYVPKSGFTGLDSFTYRIVTSADSTETVQCLVRVTPPEASGMTVLLVVNNSVYPSIQPEVERLKTDLINEGYSSRIIPFTVPAVWSQTDAKAIWDTLSREYDNRTRMLAGAILIGQMPFYKSSKDNFPKESTLVKMSAYWSMTKWEGDLEADSTIIGYRVNRGTYGGTHYTPGFLNIWVSNMNGANVPQLGTETELLKRVLQTNHEYRTGICRYPHTAWVYDQYPINNNGGVGMDARRFLKIWPSYSVHAAGDSINHPFKYEYKSGGELWQINQHSSATQYYTIYKYYSGIKVWRYTTGTEFYNTIFPFRFLLANGCVSSKFGAITNQHLLTKNSACVLASATTDYYNMGGVLIDSSKTFPADRRIRYCLSAGDHWGRAFIRSNGHIWSHVFHGDLSMKPKMGPANGKPLITALSAVKTGALSWTFTVTASDSDGGIQSYDWYPNSYADGKAKPDSSVSTNGVYNYTYASAALCTVRVEVVDAYKARDYATVIIKTDSGVVSTQVNTDTEKSPRQIAPGSVNRHGLEDAVLEVISLTGKVISVNRIPAGARTIEWNGVCSNGAKASSGLYLYRLKDNGTVTVFKNVFIR